MIKLPFLIEDYTAEDILNADEIRLFYYTLLNKTMSPKNEKCNGMKKSKDWLTVLLCLRMTGVKELHLIIGNSAKPQCFKRMNLLKLGIQWKANLTSWMMWDLMISSYSTNTVATQMGEWNSLTFPGAFKKIPEQQYICILATVNAKWD